MFVQEVDGLACARAQGATTYALYTQRLLHGAIGFRPHAGLERSWIH